MREPVCELAVVRQQQRPGRVGVEASDRDDAGVVAGDEVEDRRPPPRVAGAGLHVPETGIVDYREIQFL